MAYIINNKALMESITKALNAEINEIAEKATEKAAEEFKQKYKALFIKMASSIMEKHYQMEMNRDEMLIRIKFSDNTK